MLHHSLHEARDHSGTTYCDVKQRAKRCQIFPIRLARSLSYLAPNGFGLRRFKKGRAIAFDLPPTVREKCASAWKFRGPFQQNQNASRTKSFDNVDPYQSVIRCFHQITTGLVRLGPKDAAVGYL